MGTIWCNRLRELGWSETSVALFPFSWAPSTLTGYNRAIAQLQQFCVNNDLTFSPASPVVIADFLHDLARNRVMPQSAINNAMAAFSNLFKATDMPDITSNVELHLFANKALVKALSTKPM